MSERMSSSVSRKTSAPEEDPGGEEKSDTSSLKRQRLKSGDLKGPGWEHADRVARRAAVGGHPLHPSASGVGQGSFPLGKSSPHAQPSTPRACRFLLPSLPAPGAGLLLPKTQVACLSL